MIPYAEQLRPPYFDVYCLSEFEYRSQNSEIFFNAIEVIPVSIDGKFCDTRSGLSTNNTCYVYYLYDNFVLYYASLDRSTGELERFDRVCSAVKDTLGYRASPKVDLNINVSNHIDRTGFPTSNEPLVVYYPNLNYSVPFSDILAADSNGLELRTVDVPYNNGTIHCRVKLHYSVYRGGVVYNYHGVRNNTIGQCSCQFNLVCASVFHRRAVYGYLTADGRVVPYTKCSSIPYEKIIPQYDFFLPVSCPC